MDGGAWWAAVPGVTKSHTRLSDFSFTFHFHALEKEMATHSRVLAWRIPGTVEPGGLPSMGSHRVGHDWSNLAAAAAAVLIHPIPVWSHWRRNWERTYTVGSCKPLENTPLSQSFFCLCLFFCGGASYLETNWDLQKSCKYSTEFCKPITFSTNINILHNHSAVVKFKKLALVWCY